MIIPILRSPRLEIRTPCEADLIPCHQLYDDIAWSDLTLPDAERLARRRTWIAWSIKELRDFAFQQAKSVNDSIEISRYGILATNRRAEATEKANDLAAETSRSQLRAYVSVLGISTQNPFEKVILRERPGHGKALLVQ